nr:hypothetical protein [Lachnospiraceae bacterium]
TSLDIYNTIFHFTKKDDENVSPNLFLIDETHNLLDRARDMYSSTLSLRDLTQFSRELTAFAREQGISRRNAKEEYEFENEYPEDFENEESDINPTNISGSDDENFANKSAKISGSDDENFTNKSAKIPVSDDEIGTKNSSKNLDYTVTSIDLKGKCKTLKNRINKVKNYTKILSNYFKDLLENETFNYHNTSLLNEEKWNKIYEHTINLFEEFEKLFSNRTFRNMLNRSAHSEDILDFYFNIGSFKDNMEFSDSHYTNYAYPVYSGKIKNLILHIDCMNPTKRLSLYLENTRSAIFFSATLSPVNYFMEQFGGTKDDYCINVPSPFDPKHMEVMIAGDVSSRYTRRNRMEFEKIANHLVRFYMEKPGNYMFFMPSFALLDEIFEIFRILISEKLDVNIFEASNFIESTIGRSDESGFSESDSGENDEYDFSKMESGRNDESDFSRMESGRNDESGFSESDPGRNDKLENPPDSKNNSSLTLIKQRSNMSDFERNDFLDFFKTETEINKIGFCVLGGVFAEGIDLIGDNLIGVAILGTGIPTVTFERNIYRDYFDRVNHKGFSYAYTYPGMIKVTQAAGRLIRTETDTGRLLLLDDRFLTNDYKALFPEMWKFYKTL